MVKRLGDELASSSDNDRKKEIRDEMARECFILSKKQEEQLNDGEDEQLPF